LSKGHNSKAEDLCAYQSNFYFYLHYDFLIHPTYTITLFITIRVYYVLVSSRAMEEWNESNIAVDSRGSIFYKEERISLSLSNLKINQFIQQFLELQLSVYSHHAWDFTMAKSILLGLWKKPVITDKTLGKNLHVYFVAVVDYIILI